VAWQLTNSDSGIPGKFTVSSLLCVDVFADGSLTAETTKIVFIMCRDKLINPRLMAAAVDGR